MEKEKNETIKKEKEKEKKSCYYFLSLKYFMILALLRFDASILEPLLKNQKPKKKKKKGERKELFRNRYFRELIQLKPDYYKTLKSFPLLSCY